jgi:ATP-dependent Clp protease ATP-binding subunit ClpA
VARILAKLYKEIGILSGGQLVETDRSGLVAGYVGQTAIKTQKKIEEAMGGVLFIDEAYTLNQEGENYGQEAIDTILKAMEDNRDKFIVIVAGYTDLMRDFIESNPGLRSRFNKYMNFPDYTADELQQIFMMQCKKYQYKLTEEAEAAAREKIIKMEAEKGENFANARAVRNLFEKIITNQAARVSVLENVDDETLTTITMEDMKDLDDLDAPSAKTDEKHDPVEELIKILEKDQSERAGEVSDFELGSSDLIDEADPDEAADQHDPIEPAEESLGE